MVHMVHMMVEEKKLLQHLCRKVIKAKKNNEDKIEVWGDGSKLELFYI